MHGHLERIPQPDSCLNFGYWPLTSPGMILQVRSSKCSSFTASRVVGWFQSLFSHHGLCFSVSCDIWCLVLLKKSFVISTDFFSDFKAHIFLVLRYLVGWPPPPKNRSTDSHRSSQELLRELLSDTDSDSQPHQASEGFCGLGGSCRRAVFFLKNDFMILISGPGNCFLNLILFICQLSCFLLLFFLFEAFQDHCFSKGIISSVKHPGECHGMCSFNWSTDFFPSTFSWMYQLVLGGSSRDLVQWLGSPPFRSHQKATWKGSRNPILRGRKQTMLTNHWNKSLDDPASIDTVSVESQQIPVANLFLQSMNLQCVVG